MTPDLISDHPFAIFCALVFIMFGELFQVDPFLAAAAAILFGLNVAVTVFFTYYRRNQINGQLVKATLIRFLGYAIVSFGVLVFSNMGSGAAGGEIREIAFRGIGGIELFVLVGMVARMVPRFRPVYLSLMKAGDKILPFDFGSAEVNEVLTTYTTMEDDKTAQGGG